MKTNFNKKHKFIPYSVNNEIAKEILDNLFTKNQGQTVQDEILRAMEEYATEQTASLQVEIERLKGEVERLRGKWINIADMPEPEIPVLVYGTNELNRGRILRAQWIPLYYLEDDGDDFDCNYDEKDGIYYWPEGWYEWNDTEETHWKINYPITHWQPLPKSPVE